MKKILVVATILVCGLGEVQAADYLADRHASRSVPCASCHKTQPMSKPANEDCFACHGNWEKLAERTDNDINPHASHVEDPACTDCHAGHKRPRLLCDECHEFTDISVP